MPRLIAASLVIWTISAGVAGQALPDSSYLQLVRTVYTSTNGFPVDAVRAVAITSNGQAFAVSSGAIFQSDKPQSGGTRRWIRGSGPTNLSTVYRLTRRDHVLAGGSDGVWLWSAGQWQKETDGPREIIAFAAQPDGTPWALAPSGVWRRADKWTLVHTLDPDIVQPRDLLPRGADDCLLASQSGLFRLTGKRKYWLDFEVRPGGLLSKDTRGLASLGEDHWLVTTERGFNVATGTTGWAGFTGAEGLPIAQLTAVAVQEAAPILGALGPGPGRPEGVTVWLGSDQGLIRWEKGRFTYLAGKRWLPDDHVEGVAADSDGSVWAATRGGLAHLAYLPLTLARKADLLQAMLESRDRRHGYVTEMELRAPGVLTGARQEISDNDGLWTALYIAAQSFRYAATRSEQAREQAWRSMQALLRLEGLTGIPGFPARAICSTNEPKFQERSLQSDEEWHESPVNKGWFWKGETSSDEIDGHYFGWYIFYELAAGEEEKRQVRATCKRVTDHILDHGFYLIDHDGKPTTWGVWAPEKLNDDPIWWQERGLGSLEILSHLKVAFHLTGDARYAQASRELIQKHHYALNTLEAKIPTSVSHDNQLLFLAYYPLLQLERDPALRALYASSLARTWGFERIEANPLWNFIYGASLGVECDAEEAVQALREIPLDFILWKTRNSHRADLRWNLELGRQGIKRLRQPLPWSERVIHKWDKDPFDLDGGNDLTEGDPTIWLLPYWMGRYHALISASDAK